MSKRQREGGNGKQKRATKKAKTRSTKSTSFRKSKKSSDDIHSFDTALSFNFDATVEIPATGQLSLITQGDTIASRQGNHINTLSCQIVGVAKLVPAAGAVSASVAEMMLIFDKQPNGAVAAPADVINGTTITAALKNRANDDRFEIVRKWKFPMMPKAGVSTAYNNDVMVLDEYFKFKREFVYGATVGAVTDLRSGNLFLLAGTDGNSDDTIDFQGTFRINFLP